MTSPSRLPFNNRRSTHDWRGLADKLFNGTTIFTQIIFPTKLNWWMITDLKTKVVLTLSSSKPPLIGLFQIFFWCSVWVVVLGLEQWHFLLFFLFFNLSSVSWSAAWSLFTDQLQSLMFSLKVLPFEVGTFFLEKETVLYFHFVPVPCGENVSAVPGTWYWFMWRKRWRCPWCWFLREEIFRWCKNESGN